MEFQIPIVYTKYDARFAQILLNNINKVLNICCFKILASGNLFQPVEKNVQSKFFQ